MEVRVRYFVSYVGKDPETGTIGFGSADLMRDEPVRSIDDIEQMIRVLERWGMVKITVLNWRRFEDDSLIR